MGEGLGVSASSIVWPVRATIHTCLIVGGFFSSVVDVSPGEDESPPLSPLVLPLSGLELWPVELSPVEPSALSPELSLLEPVSGEEGAGAELSSFDAEGCGDDDVLGAGFDSAVVVVAAGACMTTTTRRGWVAAASVAFAWWSADAPTAIPKPSMSRTAAPTTRREGRCTAASSARATRPLVKPS